MRDIKEIISQLEDDCMLTVQAILTELGEELDDKALLTCARVMAYTAVVYVVEAPTLQVEVIKPEPEQKPKPPPDRSKN